MTEPQPPDVPSLGSSEEQPTPAPEERKISPDSVVPDSGKRAAFRDLQRGLVNEELMNPGVSKLLLAMLQEVDDEREGLRSYVNKFHESDKTAAVLREKVKTHTAIEIFFGVGVGLGGTIIGLALSLGSLKLEYGIIAGFVGLVLIIGAIIGRAVKT